MQKQVQCGASPKLLAWACGHLVAMIVYPEYWLPCLVILSQLSRLVLVTTNLSPTAEVERGRNHRFNLARTRSGRSTGAILRLGRFGRALTPEPVCRTAKWQKWQKLEFFWSSIKAHPLRWQMRNASIAMTSFLGLDCQLAEKGGSSAPDAVDRLSLQRVCRLFVRPYGKTALNRVRALRETFQGEDRVSRFSFASLLCCCRPRFVLAGIDPSWLVRWTLPNTGTSPSY